MGGAYSSDGGEECIGFWWRKPGGNRPMGRPRRRWESNIKIDLQEVGCGGMDWIGPAQDRDRSGGAL
jgi:hypothetical protein